MVEGMSISFTNAHGSMTVTAGTEFERRYIWAADTRTVIMWPRKKRWYGSLGMYNSGAFITGKLEPWKEHDGIKRYVVEEGQRHFTNVTDAVKWIRQGSGKPDNLDYIFNDTGLVVGMDKQPRSLDLKQASCEADRPRGGFLISFNLGRSPFRRLFACWHVNVALTPALLTYLTHFSSFFVVRGHTSGILGPLSSALP